jgi:hypothetical protein
MNEGWLLDERTMGIFLIVWVIVVLAYGIGRSRGTAPLDPIRESGPILPS